MWPFSRRCPTRWVGEYHTKSRASPDWETRTEMIRCALPNGHTEDHVGEGNTSGMGYTKAR
jgi:hypothetical protein